MTNFPMPEQMLSWLWGEYIESVRSYINHPAPLFLNNDVVFDEALETDQMLLKDPLRAYTGRWKKGSPGKPNGPSAPHVIWFDRTNLLSAPPSGQFYDYAAKADKYPWEHPGERIFVQPHMQKQPTQQSIPVWPGTGPKAGTPQNLGFRLLAQKKIKVGATEPTNEWKAARVAFPNLAAAAAAYTGFFNTFVVPALNSGPIPHEHWGYTDERGWGFTTTMSVKPDYKKLHEWINLNYGSQSVVRMSLEPPYHTHMVKSTMEILPTMDPLNPPVPQIINKAVDNYAHEEDASDATKYSGLYSPCAGISCSETDYTEKINLGKHPAAYTEYDDVDEILFLEFMQLYYDNSALQSVIQLNGTTASKIDELKGEALMLGEISNAHLAEGGAPLYGKEAVSAYEMIQNRYAEKKYLFKKHLWERFHSRMSTGNFETVPGAVVHGGGIFDTPGKYKVYKDEVFHMHGMPEDLGSRESSFNFAWPTYEKAINLLGASQLLLIPNPYLVGQFYEDWKRFMHAGPYAAMGALIVPDEKEAPPLDMLSVLTTTGGATIINQYIKNWSNVMIGADTLDMNLEQIYAAVSSIKIFGFPNYEFIEKYAPESTLYQYPWAAQLVINSPSLMKSKSTEYPDERGTMIRDIFGKKDELMLFFMAAVADVEGEGLGAFEAWQMNVDEQDFFRRRRDTVLENKKIKTFNFTDLITGANVNSAEHSPKSNKLISFDLGTEEKFNDTTSENIENAFIEFKDKIEKFQNTRSTYEILDATSYGEEEFGYNMQPFAHSEIMFYEIEKIQVNLEAQEETIVQRFFIAPPEGHDTPGPDGITSFIEGLPINFTDTQLKFRDRGYRYNVYAYAMVIGNKYQYTNIQTRGFELKIHTENVKQMKWGNVTWEKADARYYIDLNKPEDYQLTPVADIFVLNRPNIELLKTHYTSFQTLFVANKPPVHPNIVIYPYKNVNNKLLFVLSQQGGEKEEIPIEILPEDKEIFVKAALAQEKVGISAQGSETPSLLTFKSDEPDVRYQVFRIEEHPNSWFDFSTALRKPVLLPDKSRRELLAYETDFVDDLIPNKKYYYVFRTIDSRGYISNPTPIYEVELVDDSGAVYLTTKIVTFKEKIFKEPTKSMRKYVHIVPTLKQSNLKAPQGGSVFVADSQPRDFGDLFGTTKAPTRFKVRFTSKASGKMFDLNLNFVHKKNNINLIHFGESDVEQPTQADNEEKDGVV